MGAWVICSGVASPASGVNARVFCLAIGPSEEAVESFCSLAEQFLDQGHRLRGQTVSVLGSTPAVQLHLLEAMSIGTLASSFPTGGGVASGIGSSVGTAANFCVVLPPGEEKRPSIGIMPCESRLPSSFNVAPVFLPSISFAITLTLGKTVAAQ